MSDRWLTLSLAAATVAPYALLGGFGPGDSLLPWLGMFSGAAAYVLIARWGVQRGWWRISQEEGAPSVFHFALLGLTPSSTSEDVKRAFREQAKRHHPDVGGDAAVFRQLVKAKERVLADLVSG